MWEGSRFTPSESNFLQERFGEYQFILFVGRLEDVKDIPFLLSVFSNFQDRDDVKLVIVGRGNREKEYKDLAEELCPKNKVIFMGEVDPESIPECMNSSVAYVLCSKHEASPTVVKEALACGVPVVTADVGDAKDFIIEGKNGYLLPKEEEKFKEAINDLIENPLSREDVLKVSLDKLKLVSPENIAREYLNIYHEVI